MCGGTPTWNHAGRCFFSFLESFRGVKRRLARLAVLRSVIILVGVVLLWGPDDRVCVGGTTDVRNIFTSARSLMPEGLMQLMIASAIYVHVGLFVEVSRYFLSQTTSIA